MLLQIHDNLLVSDIKEKFAECFPCLKIEFYTKLHHIRENTSEIFRIDSQKKIGTIRQNRKQGFLDIKSWHTVSRIEKEFKDRFGLNVQVFRKQNGKWIQTAVTDANTLLQQMEMTPKNCFDDAG